MLPGLHRHIALLCTHPLPECAERTLFHADARRASFHSSPYRAPEARRSGTTGFSLPASRGGARSRPHSPRASALGRANEVRVRKQPNPGLEAELAQVPEDLIPESRKPEEREPDIASTEAESLQGRGGGAGHGARPTSRKHANVAKPGFRTAAGGAGKVLPATPAQVTPRNAAAAGAWNPAAPAALPARSPRSPPRGEVHGARQAESGARNPAMVARPGSRGPGRPAPPPAAAKDAPVLARGPGPKGYWEPLLDAPDVQSEAQRWQQAPWQEGHSPAKSGTPLGPRDAAQLQGQPGDRTKGCDWQSAVQGYLALRREAGRCPALQQALERAIRACSVAGRWQAARDLLVDAEESGVAQGNERMYTNAMAACGRARRPQDALALLRRMEARGLAGDVVSYTAAVSACAWVGQWESCLWLLSRMEERGIEPNVVTWTCVVTACSLVGRADIAEEVVGHMAAAGCPPNAVTLTALIRAHGKAGTPERAEEIMELMLSEGPSPSTGLGFHAHTAAWNAAIVACSGAPGRAQRRQAMSALYREMLESGCRPDEATFGALIELHARDGFLEEAEAVFGEMLLRGVRPNSTICSAMIRAFTKARKMPDALEFFGRMRDFGVVPDKYTYTALLWGAGQARDWKLTEELFAKMCRAGIKPDSITYSTLIDAYEQCGLWEKAMHVMEGMKGPEGGLSEAQPGGLIEY